MRRRVAKEIVLFTILLVALSLVMHPDFFSAPLSRLETMQNRGNYAHPLLYSAVLYLLLLPVRWFAGMLIRRIRHRTTPKG